MKWQGRQRSSNVEDRRGASGSGGMFGGRSTGSGFRIPTGRGGGGGGLGLGGLVIIIIIALVFGVNPMSLLTGNMGTTQSGTSSSSSTTLPREGEDELADFVAVVMKETEDLWSDVFKQNGLVYKDPSLVLFTGRDQSACGVADANMGPFYCPADQKVYIDLSFYDQLHRQFGAPGDFAQAYVIAHEVGHHVQQLTGVLPEFNRARASMNTEQANRASVRVELQADCYAGIWAKYADHQNLLDSSDFEEALNAAEQIGDDTIQARTQGVVLPKTFTHGTSAERKFWFQKGYDTGDVGQCDVV